MPRAADNTGQPPAPAAGSTAGPQAAGQHIQVKLQQDSKAANDLSNAYGLTVCGS